MKKILTIVLILFCIIPATFAEENIKPYAEFNISEPKFDPDKALKDFEKEYQQQQGKAQQQTQYEPNKPPRNAAGRAVGKTLFWVLLLGGLSIGSWLYKKVKGKKNTVDDNVESGTEEIKVEQANNPQLPAVKELEQSPAEINAEENNMPAGNQPRLTLSDLRELKQLLDEGIITQKEFDTAKKKILG